MFRAMAFAVRQQPAATNRMMEQLERQCEGGNLDGAEDDFEYLKFAKFRKANPPNFWGTFGPDKLEEWIKAIEKIFSVLVYIEHQKVAFATYILEADVEFWWISTRRLLESSYIVTWEVFKDAFD